MRNIFIRIQNGFTCLCDVDDVDAHVVESNAQNNLGVTENKTGHRADGAVARLVVEEDGLSR